MPASQSVDPRRKRRGDFPTPHWLVDAVVANTIPAAGASSPVRVCDPACGDGRFLVAADRALRAAGVEADLVGMDVDPGAVAGARGAMAASGTGSRWRIERGDALRADWGGARFDVVVGNPPYLSQLAAATTRGRASHLGGGPYADAAVEFLALAATLVDPAGGRIGLVLPQSILSSRDAAQVRSEFDRLATITWSWWSPRKVFDAEVVVCALSFAFRQGGIEAGAAQPWTRVVTDVLGVPELPALDGAGTVGDRARLTANFRDQYYGLVPAVTDGGWGPPLVTSGLVDPGRCWWGERDVTFAKRGFRRPIVVLDRLAPAVRRWADGMLVPKVLVANQTAVVEAVADPGGHWLPSVPVISARPVAERDLWSIAAVLTSPVASSWAWHRAAGSGLSGASLRLGPRWLAELPWPAGDLRPAVTALRRGDVDVCGRRVLDAYGVGGGDPIVEWWLDRLPDAVAVPGRRSHEP